MANLNRRRAARLMSEADIEGLILLSPEGGVRLIRTRLHKDSETVSYTAPRPRHSARAAARFSLKFGLV